MEKKLEKYFKEYLANGVMAELALVMAQTKCITDEFRELHSELLGIKQTIVAHYGESALKRMNKDE